MDQSHQSPSMNQEIFKMNIGVEATSLYLLCCGIADTGEAITHTDISAVWNGSQETLHQCLEILGELNVIMVQDSSTKGDKIFNLMPVESWKR